MTLAEDLTARLAALVAKSPALASRPYTQPPSRTAIGSREAAEATFISVLDQNRDGGLSMAELRAGAPGMVGNDNRALFAALDGDGDGKLGKGELHPPMQIGGDQLETILFGRVDGLARWLVTEADRDHNGALSLDEYSKVAPKGAYQPNQLPTSDPLGGLLSKAERAFARGDVDEDGQLSVAELHAMMNYVGWSTASPRLNTAAATDRILADADKDGDGLSKEEVNALEVQSMDVDALFQRVDKNLDGRLSQDEIQAETERLPDFYGHGAGRLADGIGEGEMALLRLLRHSVGMLGTDLANATAKRFAQAMAQRLEDPFAAPKIEARA